MKEVDATDIFDFKNWWQECYKKLAFLGKLRGIKYAKKTKFLLGFVLSCTSLTTPPQKAPLWQDLLFMDSGCNHTSCFTAIQIDVQSEIS